MAVNANEDGQDAHSVAVLPESSITKTQCESHVGFACFLELSNAVESQKCLDSQLNDQMLTTTSNLDADIEKGELESLKSSDESVANMKTDDTFTRALHREISFQIRGKFMQLLMNHSLELPKFTPRDKCMGERVYDTLTNRSKKYKRSASFNSRRVVLLFSALSIMGTMVLIYLTLRVRQLSDAATSV